MGARTGGRDGTGLIRGGAGIWRKEWNRGRKEAEHEVVAGPTLTQAWPWSLLSAGKERQLGDEVD